MSYSSDLTAGLLFLKKMTAKRVGVSLHLLWLCDLGQVIYLLQSFSFSLEKWVRDFFFSQISEVFSSSKIVEFQKSFYLIKPHVPESNQRKQKACDKRMRRKSARRGETQVSACGLHSCFIFLLCPSQSLFPTDYLLLFWVLFLMRQRFLKKSYISM